MSTLKKIYAATPTFVQDVLVSAKGWHNSRSRYGADYWNHREWLRNYDAWSLDRMMTYQSHTLANFIEHAAHNSPYYKETYRDTPWANVISPSQLPLLPVLEKEILRSRIEDFYSNMGRRFTEGHTGGTTGKSLVVRYSARDLMQRMAMLDHFKARHGFENRTMKRATFSGKPIVTGAPRNDKFWRYNAPARQMLYSTFHINESTLASYVDHLNDYKPYALDGFFTSLTELAGYIERNGIELAFQPVGIFLTSETVTQPGRDLLERVFRAKVRDQYASSEGAPFITECPHGKLHMELSTGVFEHRDATSDILVTSFSTHGTPLIRYAIGDRMSWSNLDSCTCGSPQPVVNTIEGRSTDFLLATNGAQVNSVHVANLFKNLPNSLVGAQLIQHRPGALTILLVIDESRWSDRAERGLLGEVKSAFGHDIDAALNYVTEIPREPSGKRLLVKNLMSLDR